MLTDILFETEAPQISETNIRSVKIEDAVALIAFSFYSEKQMFRGLKLNVSKRQVDTS